MVIALRCFNATRAWMSQRQSACRSCRLIPIWSQAKSGTVTEADGNTCAISSREKDMNRHGRFPDWNPYISKRSAQKVFCCSILPACLGGHLTEQIGAFLVWRVRRRLRCAAGPMLTTSARPDRSQRGKRMAQAANPCSMNRNPRSLDRGPSQPSHRSSPPFQRAVWR